MNCVVAIIYYKAYNYTAFTYQVATIRIRVCYTTKKNLQQIITSEDSLVDMLSGPQPSLFLDKLYLSVYCSKEIFQRLYLLKQNIRVHYCY